MEDSGYDGLDRSCQVCTCEVCGQSNYSMRHCQNKEPSMTEYTSPVPRLYLRRKYGDHAATLRRARWKPP